jgi:predicted ATPase/DNA-binding CsgD family transcriptional regulator
MLGEVSRTVTSPLFGRSVELAEIRRLLVDTDVRVLTLTGPGGTGKTRLAQTLGSLEWPPPGRTWYFVDLAVVHDAVDVPASIARALGVQDSGSEPLELILRDVINRSPILLVLDNFERIMGAADFVANLLDGAPDLVCLVTSREPLHIRAEQVFPVGPLAVPNANTTDFEAIASTSAVALFVNRGRARQPDFALTAENAHVVAEICRRLDGLPLAIELAAAQVSVLSPRAILARLEAREPFVVIGARDLPGRHRTLRAAVSWSYDLLDATERVVFQRCGVFSGTYAPAAVLALLPEETEQLIDPLWTLARLADKSLVRAAELGSGKPRFRMLETIRAYALDLLVERGALAEVSRKHASHFLQLAEQAEQALMGPRTAATLDRLELDYDNFRGVLHWSLDSGDLVVGLRLAGALNRFWMVRGHLGEARQWLDRALPRSTDLPIEVRAKALNTAGVLAGLQGDHGTAEVFFRESFRLWQGAGDPIRMAAAMGNLGLTAQERHDVAQALSCFEQAAALYAAGGDRRGVAVSVGARAHLARQEGRTLEAIRLIDDALAVFREVGDPRGIANSLANLGHALLALDRPQESVQHFREALELRRSLGNTLDIAECFEGFAAAAVARRQARRAARLLGAAAGLREMTGAPLPAPERKQYDDILRRIQQQLDEDAMLRERTAGRTWTLDEAVDYALISAEERASPGPPQAPLSIALTEREREVAVLVARGLTNKQIADQLRLAPRTVGTHLEHVFAKLGVQARAEVAVWITRQG